MFKNLVLDRPLAVLDLETTGVDTANDRIIEVSVLKVSPGGLCEQKTRRVNPGIPIPEAASAVHGIRDEDVAGEPSFGTIARGLVRFLDGCDLCGFNILGFDLRVLMTELSRCGVPISMDGRRVIDAKIIYHEMEPRTLAAAHKHYCGREHEGAHGAAADVAATAAVLDAQVARYEGMPATVAGLYDRFRDPNAVVIDGFFVRDDAGSVVFARGKYKGQALDAIAAAKPDYLQWMLGQDFLPDTKAAVSEALQKAGALAGAV